MPFSEAISELSEMVCTGPSSDGETQDKGLHLIDSVKHYVATLNKEVDELQTTGLRLKDEVEYLSSGVDENRVFREKVESNSIQSMDTIYYSAGNLVDMEIMEALESLITKQGSLAALRLLEANSK